MEFYTLDTTTFLRKEIVDETFTSIWIEKFNDPGEFSFTMPVSKANLEKYALNTYIAKTDTQRVGVIDTQKIKDNILTISGKDLLGLFDHKGFQGALSRKYFSTLGIPQYVEGWIKAIVTEYATQIEGYNIGGVYGSVDARQVGTRPHAMGGWRESIPNLTFGIEAANTNLVEFSIPYGSLLTGIQELAKPNNIGLTLRLEAASVGSYSLKFDYYRGKDRTTSQSVNSTVVFTTDDSFTNVEEIRSVANYKNVALAYAPQIAIALGATAPSDTGIFSFESPHPEGLNRRVLMVYAEDLTVQDVNNSAATLRNVLDLRAKSALTEHLNTTFLDGEIKTTNYKYGVDYSLGDIVELKSSYGTTDSAKISEYISIKDEAGEREYPTLEFI